MKNILFLVALMTALSDVSAQVTKRILAEHHTNTVCGICNSRNPDLKANLANNTDVVYISIHPSSPYSSCVLNKHNKADNDDRTNYNGQYGGTPRLVLNGERTITSFSSSSLFTPYRNLTTEVEIDAQVEREGSDKIKVSVEIEVVASHSYGTEDLFIALVEDTINYSAPNGETQHVNVLRDVLTDASGDSFTLPTTVGEKSSFIFSVDIHDDWNADRMKAIVAVQKASDKDVIQAFASESLGGGSGGPTTVGENVTQTGFVVYPNPASDRIQIEGPGSFDFSLINLQGQVVKLGQALENDNLDVSDLNRGLYFLQINDEASSQSLPVVLR